MKARVTLVVALLMLVPPALVTTAGGAATPKPATLPGSAPASSHDGVISGSNGTYSVTSSHAYTAAGSYTAATSITGSDGSVATATTVRK